MKHLDDFDEFNKSAHTKSLLCMAETAVASYLTESVQVKPIYKGMNFVFQITGNETGRKYVLRIHPAKWLQQSQVEAEMQWLYAMSLEGCLPVPLPINRLDNLGFTVVISGDEVSEARCCTLCRWISGDILSEHLTFEQMRQAGELLARIHEYGHTYTVASPQLFDRPRLDCDGIFGEGGIYDPGICISKLSEEHMAVVKPVLSKVRDAMDALSSCSDSYGPIHGDFYYKNLLTFEGSISAIDFDMSGWGYYCFDLAIPHWPSAIWRQGREYLDAMLLGYRAIRPFPSAQERHLPAMLAAKRLMDIYCVLARWDDPEMRAASKESVDWACSILYKWLKTGEIT